MNLAGTNVSLKARYEDQMTQYRTSFMAYQQIEIEKQQEKRAEQRRTGKVDNTPFDGSGMPRFEPPEENVSKVFQASIIDFGLLSIYTILAFVGAFVAFLRYDVR